MRLVLEPDRSPFVAGESPVFQYLQEDIEHIGVCLLYLIEGRWCVWLIAGRERDLLVGTHGEG